MDTKGKNRNQAFVSYLINLIQKDKAASARLRRADNPSTEYQAWEYLARFSVDLEKPWERLPFLTVAAGIARNHSENEGSRGLGKIISNCFEDGKESDQAQMRLRRLLACDSVDELCRVLRPLLGLAQSRGVTGICWGGLLEDLLRFHFQSKRIKTVWANDFYGKKEEEITPQNQKEIGGNQ